jgi:uncharacterized coiled-coil DUF342 family protein
MITEPIILAIINIVLGGIALKVIEYFINRSKDKIDEIAQFRKELSEENKYLREEWRSCEYELDNCRRELADIREKLIDISGAKKPNEMQQKGTDSN